MAEETRGRSGGIREGRDNDPASRFCVNSRVAHSKSQAPPLRSPFFFLQHSNLFLTVPIFAASRKSRGGTGREPKPRASVLAGQASIKVQGYRALKTVIRSPALASPPRDPTNSRLVIDLSPYQTCRAPNDRYGKLT